MSQYTCIAANAPLPEVDLSGFIKLKVKDIKQMNPQPKGPVSWDELDDEAEVLYAEKESDLGGLQIGLCNNPPYDLDHYIKYPHIYWLEGNFDERWMNQFLDYAKTQLPVNQQVEVWSIWFGEGFQEISHKHLSVTNMTKEDLRWFRQMNICIHLEE